MTRSHPSPSDDERLQMTPMIDVTFLLLVFFLCTLQFKTLDGKLTAYLPKNVGPGSDPSEPIEEVRVQVRILDSGTRVEGPEESARWSWGPDRHIEYRVGPLSTSDLTRVRHRLERLHEADPERPLVVAGRGEVAHGEMVAIVDLGIAAGFQEVRFAGSEQR